MNDVERFDQDVIKRSNDLPVVVDFWATWCAPCLVIGPILDKLYKESDGKWELVKIDTDKHPALSAGYGVKGIPNIIMFINGKAVDSFYGAMPEKEIVKWLDRRIPRYSNPKYSEALDLHKRGDHIEAQELLENILAEEPENLDVKVLLAETVLFTHPVYALELVFEIYDGDVLYLKAASIRTISRLLGVHASPISLAADPVKPLYLKAIEKLKERDFDGAIATFIEVITKNRKYDGEGARKAIVAVFQLLGGQHPAVVAHRQVFNRSLH